MQTSTLKDQEYVAKMLRDGRIATIFEDGKFSSLVFFSLCDNENEHLWNLEYEYKPHNPNGRVLVLDGLVSPNFNFRVVKKMKEVFYGRFPQIEKTVWRRQNYLDAKVYTLTRRNYHEV